MEDKKEFSVEKVNAFLNKIDKKLDTEQNKDILGKEHKEILKQWINEFNNSKEKTIKVNINKELYEKNMNNQNIDLINDNKVEMKINNDININDIDNKEGLTKENFEQKLKEKIDILLDENTSISKKEEIIGIIDKYYLTHFNIKNKIFSSEVEQLCISLLDVCPINEDNNNINNEKNNNIKDGKNVFPFSNSVMISLTLISILTKRIITIKMIYPDYNDEFPIMKNYFEKFLSILPFLIKNNDFRIRSGILNSIANMTSYMLMYKMENELLTLLQLIFDNTTISLKYTSLNLKNKITTDFHKKEAPFKESIDLIGNHTSGNFSLDFSKTSLIEIINRLPLDEGQYENIQKLLIEKSKIFIDLITNDENNDLFPILFLSYEILTTYLKMPFFKKYFNKNISSFMPIILPRCAKHISYISPRIRFWIINLLLSINSFYSLKNENVFMKNILPHICLNRYLEVEGIKKNTMVLWKQITILEGIEYIKSNYEDFLSCYLNELRSHGMIEREAACRCIQELIMKVYDENIHRAIIDKYYKDMLDLIIRCCHDSCWNIRESGFISLGYVYGNIKQNLESDKDKYNDIIHEINTLIKLHCFDNVIEVRDAAAYALEIYIEKGGIVPDKFLEFYVDIIKNLNDIPKLNEYLNPIKKEIFSYITDKQDFGFLREVDEQDFTDGINHIIKEISSLKEKDKNFVDKKIKIDELIMIVIDNLCKNYNIGLSNLNKKTIWETLTVLFLKVEKYDVEMYLDYIIDILIKELDLNLSSMCGYQAQKFVEGIVKGGINKRMIKGKVRSRIKSKPNLVKLFDQILK